MPICPGDPWRDQFFENVFCSEHVLVPLKDHQAWQLFPKFRKIYDKLFVALSQGLTAAPHGVVPPSFPVFSKPITNLMSMGTGSLLFPDLETYRQNVQPGHFWETYLTGDHISSDVAVVNGNIVWWRHSKGFSLQRGTFDYFHVEKKNYPEVEEWCGSWAKIHLAGYTGMANFETIGNRIIEAHLRFTDQWPDLYGPGWIDAVVNLYGNQTWNFDTSVEEEGFSVVLFGPHGPMYSHPPKNVVEEALNVPGVLSIQIAFHDDARQKLQSNPPGGVRLAIINAKSLEAGDEARKILRQGIYYKLCSKTQKMNSAESISIMA